MIRRSPPLSLSLSPHDCFGNFENSFSVMQIFRIFAFAPTKNNCQLTFCQAHKTVPSFPLPFPFPVPSSQFPFPPPTQPRWQLCCWVGGILKLLFISSIKKLAKLLLKRCRNFLILTPWQVGGVFYPETISMGKKTQACHQIYSTPKVKLTATPMYFQ